MSFLDEIQSSSYEELLEEQGVKERNELKKELSFDSGKYMELDEFIPKIQSKFYQRNKNIPTDSLRVNGQVIADDFHTYLVETKPEIDIDKGEVQSGYFQSGHLKAISKTPKHLAFALGREGDLEEKVDESKFVLGTAIHACILEKAKFSRYTVLPDIKDADGKPIIGRNGKKLTKNSNEYKAMVAKHWTSVLEDLFLKDENNVRYAKEKLDAAIELIFIEMGLPTEDVFEDMKNLKVKLMQDACNILAKVSQRAKAEMPLMEYYRAIEDLYNQILHLDGRSFKSIKDGYSKLDQVGVKALLVPNKKGEIKLDKFREVIESCIMAISCDQTLVKQEEYDHPVLSEKNWNSDLLEEYIERLTKATAQGRLRKDRTADSIMSVTQVQMNIINHFRDQYETFQEGILPKLFTYAKKENTFYCKDFNGIPLKIRPDAINFEENVGVNIHLSVKSTAKASPRQFMNHYAELGYDLADAMYIDVLEEVTGRKNWVSATVAIQTKAPYSIMLLFHLPEAMALGAQKFYESIESMKQTIAKGKFPGFEVYSEEGHFGFIAADLPLWRYKEASDMSRAI